MLIVILFIGLARKLADILTVRDLKLSLNKLSLKLRLKLRLSVHKVQFFGV